MKILNLMKIVNCKLKIKRGFALIEMLVGVFILVTVGLAIAGAFVSAVKSVTYTKTVIAATALANTEMETLHNLPYNDLATDSGSIPLPVPNVFHLLDDKEVIGEGGIKFNVRTRIVYFDDLFDGLGEDDANDAPYDYKKVSISVGLPGKPALTTLATNIGAKAAETPTNTGILKICVKTAPSPYGNPGSQPVIDAKVVITNDSVSPPQNRTGYTEFGTGCITFYKLPPNQNKPRRYHVVVTKDNYSTDYTYGGPANQNPHAEKADQDVEIQKVTSLTLFIDLFSSMEIQFRDASGKPIPSVAFTLSSARLESINPPTPKYLPKNLVADADGKYTIPDLEFDDYSISVSGSNHLIALSPIPTNLEDPNYPIQLFAEINPLSVIATLSTSTSDPTITSINPISDQVGQTATIQVLGSNFQNNLVAKLYRMPENGDPRVDITGTTTFVNSGKINTVMNLTGAAIGKWNLEIINYPDNKKVVLFNGFEVTN